MSEHYANHVDHPDDTSCADAEAYITELKREINDLAQRIVQPITDAQVERALVAYQEEMLKASGESITSGEICTRSIRAALEAARDG